MGIELFERAVQGGGQLLRAEVGYAGDGALAAVLLTFDLGRIAVLPEPATGSLSIEYVDVPERVPDGLSDASEEEPWWRLLGQPIARVWPAGPADEGSVSLQFRADDQNPRIVTLAPRASGVSVRLESPPA